MYLQGKLNQNAHITLRALEDWQQLNLSVKNLVKDLKTFDLPVSKMIRTIQSKRYLWHLALVTARTCNFFFFRCSVSLHVCFCVCLFQLVKYLRQMRVCSHQCVCTHACAESEKKKMPLCKNSLRWYVYVYACACDHVRACMSGQVWRGLSPRGTEVAERTLAMFVD